MSVHMWILWIDDDKDDYCCWTCNSNLHIAKLDFVFAVIVFWSVVARYLNIKTGSLEESRDRWVYRLTSMGYFAAYYIFEMPFVSIS